MATDSTDPADTTDSLDAAETPVEPLQPRSIRKFVLLVVLAGVVVQLLLSAYYLGVAHSPAPHNLPVGFVSAPEQVEAVHGKIDTGHSFKSRSYPDDASMLAALKQKKIYGGVDLTAAQPHLFIATAAGAQAASAIRNAFTSVVSQQVGEQVQQLVAKGSAVSPTVVQSLTAPPAVTDVTPLPKADRAGGSLGLLVQALALGATIASLGLGRLRGKTAASLRRGVGHVITLSTYAALSAIAVLLVAHAFGVVPAGATVKLYFACLLLSLAITGSTAGFVALFGPIGALAGTAYFTLGVIISGSSVLPEFLPPFGRVVGQVLPTGAGVTAMRDSLYFPDASLTGPILVLSIYAGLGLLVVLVTNAMANLTSRHAVL